MKTDPNKISEIESLLLDNTSKIIVYCHKKPNNYESWNDIEFVEINKKSGKLDLTAILKDLSGEVHKRFNGRWRKITRIIN